jgi:hypothetical protein
MICPNCRAETSDMMNVCELCGQPLLDSSEGPSAERPPGDATIWIYPKPADTTGSEWTLRETTRAGRKSGTGSRWYLSPWPYLIGMAVVAVVTVSLLTFHSSAKAYPELVTGNQPTLLDFYTDT